MSARQGSLVVDENAAHVTSILEKQHEHAVIDGNADLDAQALAALGYKQEFKRDFTIWESFSVSFSVLGLLPSIASTLSWALYYSGTAGTVWGYLIAALLIQSTAFSMAELCSSMPTAGGLYYAAAVMAPEGWGPLASWFVGWSNFFGFVTGPCSLNYALASMIVTAAEVSFPGYSYTTWQIYLIFLLLLASQGVLTMQSTKFIGRLNLVSSFWNMLVIFVFIIWFPAGSINHPKTNHTHAVWTEFTNGTDWPIGWSTCLGFLTTIWTMSGYDAPFHLSEECSNANIASPRAIIMTAQGGLYLGWAIIIVIVYTVKDIPAIFAQGQPFGNLCFQVLGNKSGMVMFAFNMVAQYFCAQGCIITASRIIFAYSRDGAILGSKYWSKVDKRTKTPVFATWGVIFIAALLGLLMFGGPIAIGAVFSIGAMAQYTSFTTPVFLKLFFSHHRFRPGPWNLGKFSRTVNAIAVAWWVWMLMLLNFPAAKGKDLNLATMNWTCLIWGGAMLLVMIYYAVDARKWFRGPRINIEHIHGVAADSGSGLSHSSENVVPKQE